MTTRNQTVAKTITASGLGTTGPATRPPLSRLTSKVTTMSYETIGSALITDARSTSFET